MVDWTYIDNVVHGHILASEKLEPQSTVCGKVGTDNSFFSFLYYVVRKKC
jgi:hypothetical protein